MVHSISFITTASKLDPVDFWVTMGPIFASWPSFFYALLVQYVLPTERYIQYLVSLQGML